MATPVITVRQIWKQFVQIAIVRQRIMLPRTKATVSEKEFRNCMEVKKTGTCDCGRSPTGDCIGWHRLTEAEYRKKLLDKANIEIIKAASMMPVLPKKL